MNKQLPTILAIATLMVLSFSGCKKAEKKTSEDVKKTTDSTYVETNGEEEKDSIVLFSPEDRASYLATIATRKNKPKYAPIYEKVNESDEEYPEITTNSDKMPMYSLDKSLANQNLLQRLTDCYNSARIFMSAREDAEIYERFGEDITDVADCIDKLNCSIIQDKQTRQRAVKYKNVCVDITSVDHDDLETDYYEALYEAWDDFYKYIVENYKMSHYGNLSQEETDKVMDPNKYLADWDALQEKIASEKLEIQEGISLRKELVTRYDKADNFHKKCLLGIMIAHLDDKISVNDEETKQTGLAILEDLLMAKKYSYFLQHVFGDWRCLKQVNWGFSNDSAIPNYYYNMLRREAFDTMISYIATHPKDLVAINVANYLSLLDDTYRYLSAGGLSIGNYNIADYYERF